MTLNEKAAIWALESAYWQNWCGDHEYARRKVIRIANVIIKEAPSGQGKQESQVVEQEEEESLSTGNRAPWDDDFLIR